MEISVDIVTVVLSQALAIEECPGNPITTGGKPMLSPVVPARNCSLDLI